VRKPIIIGMNNPISLAPGHELYPLPDGCTGNRLWKMLDASMQTRGKGRVKMKAYLDAFERRNLVIDKAWNKVAARARAHEISIELFGSKRTVVLLGTEVANAFGLPPLKLVPTMVGGIVFRQVPHPSGRNLWYNTPENMVSVGNLLADLYEESIREDA
jgi:hypothetical protein